MSDAAELTTRDVFAQIDRRLSRLEEDVRDFRRYVEARFASFEAKGEARFASFGAKVEARFASFEAKVEARFSGLEAKVDRNFRWTMGLVFGAWATLMATVLLR